VTKLLVSSMYSRWCGVGRLVASVYLTVCLGLRIALKGNRLELAAPKSVDIVHGRTLACTDFVVKSQILVLTLGSLHLPGVGLHDDAYLVSYFSSNTY